MYVLKRKQKRDDTLFRKGKKPFYPYNNSPCIHSFDICAIRGILCPLSSAFAKRCPLFDVGSFHKRIDGELPAAEFYEPLKSFHGSMDEHNLRGLCRHRDSLTPFNLKCVGVRIKVWLNHRMIARSYTNLHNFLDYMAAYLMRCI
ncbi:hypothetical protein PUN28_004756 [Cardiocondyla obscurior]|uniref:Uncharacterized protein n=1 Tax=Cardiocondyla obscurior TaxID=286306 RepID=A0AAW2GED3_9HYME